MRSNRSSYSYAYGIARANGYGHGYADTYATEYANAYSDQYPVYLAVTDANRAASRAHLYAHGYGTGAAVRSWRTRGAEASSDRSRAGQVVPIKAQTISNDMPPREQDVVEAEADLVDVAGAQFTEVIVDEFRSTTITVDGVTYPIKMRGEFKSYADTCTADDGHCSDFTDGRECCYCERVGP